jgi:integrase
MKLGKSHRVPLSDAALDVLEKVRGLDSEYCFPSPAKTKDGRSKPQSVMVFKSLYGRMGINGITTHGFRSAFRDWASEAAHAPREVAEAALAHATGSGTERAYARSSLFDRRKVIMESWADHITGRVGDVVRLSL